MSPTIFSELFRWRDISYNLRSNSNFLVPNVKSVFHESDSCTFDVVPLELKELTCLSAFKKVLKMATKNVSLQAM